jgi:hypothetical protein
MSSLHGSTLLASEDQTPRTDARRAQIAAYRLPVVCEMSDAEYAEQRQRVRASLLGDAAHARITVAA